MPARASSEQQNPDILQNALQLNDESGSPLCMSADLNAAALMGNIISDFGDARKNA